MTDKRLFVAVPISEPQRIELASYINQLSSSIDLAWTPPENLHITLVFLGETPETQVPIIQTALAKALVGQHPFKISFSQPGYFPASGALWLKINCQARQLENLADTVRQSLHQAGVIFDNRHRFTPHLTIARNRNRVPIDLANLPTPAKIETKAEQVILFESRLTRPRATYEALATWHLN